MKESTFQLLGIRPTQYCSTEFSKVLERGNIYSFYDNYTFLKEDSEYLHSPVKEINFTATGTEELYNIGDLNISISAIVGKNGYGKSTLLELLFAAIYALSIEKKVLGKQHPEILEGKLNKLKNKSHKSKLDAIEQVKDDIFKLFKEKITDEKKIDESSYLQFEKKYEERKSLKEEFERQKINDRYEDNRLTLAIQEYYDLLNKVKVEIFYRVENNCFMLRIDDDTDKAVSIRLIKSNLLSDAATRDFTIDELLQEPYDLSSYFFYTVATNYSHYALNSNKIGEWIKQLFHKNDGYRTPIVVNPMRSEGNFDINDEIEFAKYRLLFNILVEQYLKVDDKEIIITDKQSIVGVKFTYNFEKLKKPNIRFNENGDFIGDARSSKMIEDILSDYFPEMKLKDLYKANLPFFNEIVNYIVQKVDKISRTYEEYEQGYKNDLDQYGIINEQFIKDLLNDDSHITYKLHQAISFLSNCFRNRGNQSIIDWHNEGKEQIIYQFTAQELLNWMNVKDASEIYKQLPPAIFNIDFILSGSINELEVTPTFDSLSSGEQQLIHSTQSVVYHLLNLQSVHLKPKRDNLIDYRYRYINLVFDEIELYFHPDFQRRYIDELLKAIARIKNAGLLENIMGINMIFSTHSPFILSDMKEDNVMLLRIDSADRLARQVENKSGTFAANIHELLAQEFFMSKGFMGEFAKSKIISVTEYLVNCSENPQLIDTSEVWNVISVKNFIEIIGEPLIKQSLLDLYHVVFRDISKEEIQKVIDELIIKRDSL